MFSEFGTRVRQLREGKQILQRQVASEVEIDIPMLSKIERCDRRAKKSQILLFAIVMKGAHKELFTLWLADHILEIVNGETVIPKAIHLASKRLPK